MSRPRLRERPLTVDSKVRIILAFGGWFYVERMTAMGPDVKLKRTYPTAIAQACQWARERPLEVP